MPISAGLREDIAVYRGFIGQQYFLLKGGSSGFWSDKVCHLCLEFEVMSHGGTERTEDY